MKYLALSPQHQILVFFGYFPRQQEEETVELTHVPYCHYDVHIVYNAIKRQKKQLPLPDDTV